MTIRGMPTEFFCPMFLSEPVDDIYDVGDIYVLSLAIKPEQRAEYDKKVQELMWEMTCEFERARTNLN